MQTPREPQRQRQGTGLAGSRYRRTPRPPRAGRGAAVSGGEWPDGAWRSRRPRLVLALGSSRCVARQPLSSPPPGKRGAARAPQGTPGRGVFSVGEEETTLGILRAAPGRGRGGGEARASFLAIGPVPRRRLSLRSVGGAVGAIQVSDWLREAATLLGESPPGDFGRLGSRREVRGPEVTHGPGLRPPSPRFLSRSRWP